MTRDKLEPVKGATPSGVFIDEFASFPVQTSTGSEAETKPTECDPEFIYCAKCGEEVVWDTFTQQQIHVDADRPECGEKL